MRGIYIFLSFIFFLLSFQQLFKALAKALTYRVMKEEPANCKYSQMFWSQSV